MSHADSLRFTKMQGAGNDYVYINCLEPLPQGLDAAGDWAHVAVAVSDRHFGIGSDGLVLICPSRTADLRMRMFNADGSEAEMCGNAVRCVAKYAYERGLCRREEMTIQTLAGKKHIQLALAGDRVEGARVNMGAPALRRGDIPMTGDADDEAVDAPLTVAGTEYTVTCVSMGNPHCCIFVDDDVDAVPLETLGPAIENHEAFPERINVHVVNVLARDEVKMRTWERGAGITLACGTGAAAVCVAAARTGRTERTLAAHLPGGGLTLEWADTGEVFMTGPAVEVFEGEWPLPRRG